MPRPPTDTLGAALLGLRVRHGWSRKQTASLLGLTSAYVRDLEQDRSLPAPETLSRMEAAFGLPADSLLILLERERDCLGTGCSIPQWLLRDSQNTERGTLYCAYCDETPPDACGGVCNLACGAFGRCPQTLQRACPCAHEPSKRRLSALEAWCVERGYQIVRKARPDLRHIH